MIWKYRKNASEEAARELSRELEKPVKYCQLLLNRGLRGPDEVKAFTSAELKALPLPETMPGMA